MSESSPPDRRLLAVKRIGVWTFIALSAWSAAACRRTPTPGEATRALRRLRALEPFRPPPDGQLTDLEIDRYIRVRRAARGQRTDREAASAAGIEPGEYAWVRARVIEALVALDDRKVRAASEETYARTIASLRQTRQSAHDQETQRALDEQIVLLERERASLKQVDAMPLAVSLNAKRVLARRAEIEALPP